MKVVSSIMRIEPEMSNRFKSLSLALPTELPPLTYLITFYNYIGAYLRQSHADQSALVW